MEPLNSTALTPNCPGGPHAVPVGPKTISALVLLSLCFLLGVPGNIAVIILRPNWQHLNGLSQTLMLNLAVSDLCCLLVLPLWIYALLESWAFGPVACKLVAYLVYCSLYCSLLTVTVLSVQRCLHMVYLQGCLCQLGRIKLLALLWLVAMALSIYVLVERVVITEQNKELCVVCYSSQAEQLAVLLTESLVGFASFFVLVFSYICVYRRVNQGAFFNHPQTTRLVTSIILAFFALWMPHHVINVLGVAAISLNNERLLRFCTDSWRIVSVLPFMNSCLNPLLYAFASRHMCTLCQRTENGT